MTIQIIHKKLKLEMAKLGFDSLKSRIYTKEFYSFYQVILLDCTSDKTEFRLWSSIRIKSSNFPSLALNGKCSYGNNDRSLNSRICYARVNPTIDDMVNKIIEYSKNNFIPWFDKYSTFESLTGAMSPLNGPDKELLVSGATQLSIETSLVLGIKGEIAQQGDAPAPASQAR